MVRTRTSTEEQSDASLRPLRPQDKTLAIRLGHKLHKTVDGGREQRGLERGLRVAQQ